jgi:hypothetical protein
MDIASPRSPTRPTPSMDGALSPCSARDPAEFTNMFPQTPEVDQGVNIINLVDTRELDKTRITVNGNVAMARLQYEVDMRKADIDLERIRLNHVIRMELIHIINRKNDSTNLAKDMLNQMILTQDVAV